MEGVGGSFTDLAQQWIASKTKLGHLGGRSPYSYKERLDSFTEYIARERTLDKSSVLGWQHSIAHLAPESRRAYIGTAKRFCRWLHIEGHIRHDLTVYFTTVKVPRSVPRALTKRDVARLLGSCERQRDTAIVWVMVMTGLRCAEVAGLNLDDYDPDAATLFVRGKGGHERVLPLPEQAAAALQQYLNVERGWRPGPLLCGVGSKTPPDGRMTGKSVSKLMARLMLDARIHQSGDGKTAHALRHTAASDVLDRCHDLPLVQQMLGHASLATTQRYLRVADLDRLRTAMEGRTYLDAAVYPLGATGSENVSPLRGAPRPGASSPAAGDPTKGDIGAALIPILAGLAALAMTLALMAPVRPGRRRAVTVHRSTVAVTSIIVTADPAPTRPAPLAPVIELRPHIPTGRSPAA